MVKIEYEWSLGTLSPLKSFATEMNVDFKYTIEAMSSIDVQKQVLFSTSS